jgi:hypothetical protein
MIRIWCTAENPLLTTQGVGENAAFPPRGGCRYFSTGAYCPHHRHCAACRSTPRRGALPSIYQGLGMRVTVGCLPANVHFPTPPRVAWSPVGAATGPSSSKFHLSAVGSFPTPRAASAGRDLPESCRTPSEAAIAQSFHRLETSPALSQFYLRPRAPRNESTVCHCPPLPRERCKVRRWLASPRGPSSSVSGASAAYQIASCQIYLLGARSSSGRHHRSVRSLFGSFPAALAPPPPAISYASPAADAARLSPFLWLAVL